jgi:crotonobetainyl-CoA:carnitine CoA-transferase CaiB-like acyl-CoA transferase
MSGQTSETALLQDLLVVEVGARVAAGAAGGLLAGMGAEVVLVEPARPGADHKWAQRATMAVGKRSVIVGDAALAKLLGAADIVLLSSDISADDLAIWNGELPAGQIVCDFTAFGHSGPLAGQPVSEALVQATAGIADTTGRRDGPPAISGAPFLDMETAAYGVAAILAAVRARRRYRIGQRIDMALYDVAVNALLTFLPLRFVRRPATRNGNRHPTLAPWNAYRARDGFVLICAPTNEQWRKLCVAMGRTDLVEDARFATPTTRLENVEAIDAAIEGWTSRLSVQECIEIVSVQAIPCSPIVGLDDLAAEPNLRHRQMVHDRVDPVSGNVVRVPGSPVRIKDASPVSIGDIPARGADSDQLDHFSSNKPGNDIRAGNAGAALAGLRVIEVGMNTVAPLACRQLGALGADVIKVEPPIGDSNRINAPLRDDGESFVFALSNTDKRGIVLDLRQAADRETLLAMLASADVMMENLKPGSLDRLGFSSGDMLKRFPRLIYCSVNGFGYDSVYPGRPALDTVIQGMSGAMDATRVEGVPTKAGISISDQLGGQIGLLSILAALEWREHTGRGLALDLAMQDCTAWATQSLWNDAMPTGQGARIIAASDGYVAVEGDADILGAVSASTRAELVARLDGRDGCRAAPVLSVTEVLDHPQTLARILLVDVPTSDGSSWRVLASPLRLLETPPMVRSAMSRLGYLDAALAREFDLQPASIASPVEA